MDNPADQSVTIDIPVTSQTEVPQESVEQPQIETTNTSETLKSEVLAPPMAPVLEQPKEANPIGRPCEYCKRKEEIDKLAKEYLQTAREAKETRKPFIPYLQELADKLDCDSDRVSIWANKKLNDEMEELEHPEFHGIIKSINNLKELLLLQRTLGRYNPTGAIFQLKTKHGYIETEKKLLASEDNEPLKIIIVDEKKEERVSDVE